MTTHSSSPPATRYGVVAVIKQQDRFLVIRRSQTVIAPGAFCFPGGGIEPGESEEDALRRELLEELNVACEPIRRLWNSRTSWNVDLVWWEAELSDDRTPEPDPSEVASWHWFSIDQMRALEGLLSSNHAFLEALERGDFRLSS